MDKIDLEELERLAKAATPVPWEMVDARAFLDDEDFEIRNRQHCIGYGTSGADAAYIVAACNSVPELIARIRELERQMDTLAGFAAMSEKCVLDKCVECEHRNGPDCGLDFFDMQDCYLTTAKEAGNADLKNQLRDALERC